MFDAAKTALGDDVAGLEFAALVAAAEAAGPGADLALYQAWLAANPGAPHGFAAWFNFGAALSREGRPGEAAACYRNAVALRPAFLPARLNLGLVLEKLGHEDEALAEWAAALQPDDERTALLNQRARLMERLGRLDDAEQALRASLLTDPAQPDAVQHWVHVRQKSCTWPVLEPLPGLDAAALLQGAGPLGVLALTDDVVSQREAAAAWIARKTVAAPARLSPADGYAHGRIRLGYISSDFCRHAMSYLVAELFERHDRARFEVYGYCSSPDDGSALRTRVLESFDQVRMVRELDDEAAARLIRADEIDVLIDLNGLTSGSRLQVLRWRPAPVQATYLGFVGPVPLPELDYVLCDAVTVPPELAGLYAPAPLPVGPVYQANDTRRAIGPTPARAVLGLPEQGFVLCCFSNHYKITSEMFGAWLRVLQRAPGAVLWLAADTPWSRARLVRAAEAAGVGERLVFAPRCDPEAYMGRLAAADLFLDTFPYNAGTVASDALRMGLPLLTLEGQAFAARMAASLLRRMGAGPFVTASLADYEAMAVRLATDRAMYAAGKAFFSRAAWDATLGDAAGFARGFEAAIASVAMRALPRNVPAL